MTAVGASTAVPSPSHRRVATDISNPSKRLFQRPTRGSSNLHLGQRRQLGHLIHSGDRLVYGHIQSCPCVPCISRGCANSSKPPQAPSGGEKLPFVIRSAVAEAGNTAHHRPTTTVNKLLSRIMDVCFPRNFTCAAPDDPLRRGGWCSPRPSLTYLAGLAPHQHTVLSSYSIILAHVFVGLPCRSLT